MLNIFLDSRLPRQNPDNIMRIVDDDIISIDTLTPTSGRLRQPLPARGVLKIALGLLRGLDRPIRQKHILVLIALDELKVAQTISVDNIVHGRHAQKLRRRFPCPNPRGEKYRAKKRFSKPRRDVDNQSCYVSARDSFEMLANSRMKPLPNHLATWMEIGPGPSGIFFQATLQPLLFYKV